MTTPAAILTLWRAEDAIRQARQAPIRWLGQLLGFRFRLWWLRRFHTWYWGVHPVAQMTAFTDWLLKSHLEQIKSCLIRKTGEEGQ